MKINIPVQGVNQFGNGLLLQFDTQTIQQGYKSQDNTASTFGLAKMIIAGTNALPSISKVACEGVPTKESHMLI